MSIQEAGAVQAEQELMEMSIEQLALLARQTIAEQRSKLSKDDKKVNKSTPVLQRALDNLDFLATVIPLNQPVVFYFRKSTAKWKNGGKGS